MSALPSEAAARVEFPMFDGLLAYFPAALAEVARCSKVGNDQHNPGEPLHWAMDKSTDHANKIIRHLADYGTDDSDTIPHSVKVAWRALALAQEDLMARKGAAMPRNGRKAEDVAGNAVGTAWRYDTNTRSAKPVDTLAKNACDFSFCNKPLNYGRAPDLVDAAMSRAFAEIFDEAARRVDVKIEAKDQTFGEFKRSKLTAKQQYDIKLAADMLFNAKYISGTFGYGSRLEGYPPHVPCEIRAQHPMHAETLRERDASGV